MTINDFIIENNLKVVLVKLFNQVNIELNVNMLQYLINKYNATPTNLLNAVKNIDVNLENKIMYSNYAALTMFNLKYYEFVLPLLEYAYTLDPNNDDTLYNIGIFLEFVGEKQMALEYLSKIKNKDEGINKLIQRLKV